MFSFSMSIIAFALVTVAFSLPTEAWNTFSSSPTVSLKSGRAQGIANEHLGVDAFLGLPYATAERFGNPVLYNKSFDGTFDATSFGNVCPGYGPSSTANASLGQNYVIDEDCLNINIIRPSGTDAGDQLPILFWVYGGGFVQGTANDPRYNGSYLVQRSVEMGKPMIFASVNYRLAAFGFPAGQAAASAGVLNLGLKDQRKALEWVKHNIGAFGGDKNKVTIWGQSAGGASVIAQLVAYGGNNNGLFRAAIEDSGYFIRGNSSLESQSKSWNTFLEAAGCSDDLDCLRSASFDKLFSAANGTFTPSTLPDGEFLQTPVTQLVKSQKISQVPLMLGTNLDEATFGIGAPTGLMNDSDFNSALQSAFSTISMSNSTFDRLLEAYPNNQTLGCPFNTGDGVISTGLQDKRINWLYTDSGDAGARLLARQHSKKAPVYKYLFAQVPQNYTIDVGVSHIVELPYIFGITELTARNPMSTRPEDLKTSKMLQQYWINFVHDLKPCAENGPEWTSYSDKQDALIVQNSYSGMISDDFRQENIELQIKIATGEM